ncbi:MAG: hypothetical protein KF847_12580 [Pirellulales bacterium]|nr:hypothetical protein [Pirellulales bacterium]
MVDYRKLGMLYAGCLLWNMALAGNGYSQAQFRLQASGELTSDQGLVIRQITPRSPLARIRKADGAVVSAKPGDRVVAVNERPFSPDLLRSMSPELILKSGVVELQLVDSRTDRATQYSAVLRREDVDRELLSKMVAAIREETAELPAGKVEVSEDAETVTIAGLHAALFPRTGNFEPTPLSNLVSCQAGLDALRSPANAEGVKRMISPDAFARAGVILENALAEVSQNPEGEQGKIISDNACEAILDELWASIGAYANRQGKQVHQRKSYGSGMLRFRPVTDPMGCTVEVIPRADVRLILLRNPGKSNEIDLLAAWTPLPTPEAALYGRYYFRLRKSDGALHFGYRADKSVVVTAAPPSGEILFR